MIKEKRKIDTNGCEFQELGESSPELKPQENQFQDQISSTERSDNIEKSSPNSIQNYQTEVKQSNLIKVIPVLQLNADEDSNFSQQKQQNSKQKKKRKKRFMKLQNIERKQVDSNERQSPLFFNLQAEEEYDNSNKQQIVGFSPPQSSRRGLNPKRRQKRKKLQQPQKIIQKTQKTQSTFRQEQLKRQKMKQQAKEKQKLPTQIYKYEEQSDESQSYKTDSQQQDQLQQNDKVEEIQYKFQRKLKVEQEKSQKTQIFFKSNSFFTLINAEIPKGKHINCILRKKREGIFSMTTKYQLFLYDDKKYLMTAVKTSYKLTSHFEFYKDKEITQSARKNKQCLYGILDSNFSGTQYVLKTVIQYDTISERSTAVDRKQMILQESQTVISDQCSQQKIKFPQQTESNKQKQKNQDLQIKQVCYINFKASLMGLGGQRDVKILKRNNKKITRSDKFSDLKNAFDNGQFDKLKEITTRKAQKGAEGYQLDFKGFAKMNSDKNIILQNSKGIQNLIFGKAKEDIYFLSISHPFSILQGFAFGVSNLDGKVFVN